MVEIKQYEDSDFQEIQHWYKKRGIEFNNRAVLPSVGFMVNNIGAGFIYMTDSCIAFIEGYITNPDAESELRNAALNSISECLISHAIVMGVKFIKCETTFPEIELRALKFGFKSLGKTVSLVKEV